MAARHETPGTDDAEMRAVDAQLMARVQEDDEAALAALMEQWELPVKAVIGRIVLNASEADELAEETFVRVWQQRAKYRRGAPFRPWLFAIAVNLARNRLRWWRRRPTVELHEWTPTATSDASGSARLERTERVAAVQRAIADLPGELREALVLFEYENLAQAEIALIVGATIKAVETRIARAKEKLRAALRTSR